MLSLVGLEGGERKMRTMKKVKKFFLHFFHFFFLLFFFFFFLPLSNSPASEGFCLSIRLDGTIDLAGEPQTGEEPDGACEDKEEDAHDKGPAKVQQQRDKVVHLQADHVVEDAVKEDVERRAPGREERPPPPAVVLRAEVKVAHEDGDLRARDNQDHEDQGQEAEDVVDPIEPDAVHDEIELDEDGSKGENAAQENGGDPLEVERLGRNLPRDLVHPDWKLCSLRQKRKRKKTRKKENKSLGDKRKEEKKNGRAPSF